MTQEWRWKWNRSFTSFVPKTSKFKDLTDQEFGRLTARYPVRIEKCNKIRWSCDCQCGTKNHLVIVDNLTRGQVKSCGCIMYVTGKEHFNADWIGNISKGHVRSIKSNAEVRGILFEITHEYLADLFEKQLHACPYTGLPLVSGNLAKKRTASLDRIDSKLPYVEGNVQWIHKDVNRMKCHFPEEHFIRVCTLIAEKAKSTILST